MLFTFRPTLRDHLYQVATRLYDTAYRLDRTIIFINQWMCCLKKDRFKVIAGGFSSKVWLCLVFLVKNCFPCVDMLKIVMIQKIQL